MSDWEIVREPKSDWEIVKEPQQQVRTLAEGQNLLARMLQSGAKTGHGAFTGFDTAVQEMTHGALQPALESGYLGEALQRRSPQAAQEREQRYQQSKAESPYATTLGYGGGKLAPDLLAAYATGGGSQAVKIPKYIQYLKAALGGGLGGAISGGAEYVNPGQSREHNALVGGLTGAVLPILGAAGHAAHTGIKSAGNTAKHLGKALDPEFLTSKLLENIEKHEAHNTGLFSKFHENAKSVIPAIPKEFPLGELKKALSRGEYETIVSALHKPSTETFHESYKELGKFLRGFENGKKGLVGAERRQYEAVENAQKILKESMYNALNKEGRKDLIDLFGEANKDYIENIVTHQHPVINQYKAGKITKQKMLKKLANNDVFEAELGSRYPDIMLRNKLPAIGKGIGIGTGLVGGPAIYDILFGGK